MGFSRARPNPIRLHTPLGFKRGVDRRTFGPSQPVKALFNMSMIDPVTGALSWTKRGMLVLLGFLLVLAGSDSAWGFTRPALPTEPSGDVTVIVNKRVYGSNGKLKSVFDNEGKETRYEYDAMGRRTKMIENYVNGVPLNSVPDVDRITTYKYNAAGQVIEQAADLEGTADDQVTHYVYSGELNDPLKVGPVAQNDLLVATIYPDGIENGETRLGVISDIDGGTPGGDYKSFTYTATGQTAMQKDQRGTEITYDYDNAGRMTQQEITAGSAPGTQKVTYTHNNRGLVETVTTNDGTNDTSAVKYTYDGFGRPLKEFQAHDGTVVETGSSASPSIELAYDIASTTGYRLAGMVYPNGTEIDYGYGTSGGINDALSRPSEILGHTGPSTTIELAQYSYTGAGRIASKTLGSGLTTNNEALTLSFDQDHPDTSSTEAYGGYDRFGRIARMHWEMVTPANGGTPKQRTDIFDIRHGYDAAGNKLYTERNVYKAHSQHFTHDALDRLEDARRGVLKPVEAPTGGALLAEDLIAPDGLKTWQRHKDDRDLDVLGNADAVHTRERDDMVVSDFNDSNEITSRKMRADRQKATIKDHFTSSSTLDNWELIGSGDGKDIYSGRLWLTGVSQDTINGTQESEARAVALWGEDSGPINARLKLIFPGGVSTGQAGLVFGYQDPHNYWMMSVDLGADEMAYYQIKNGVKYGPHDSRSWSVTAGSSYNIHIRTQGRGFAVTGYPFNKLTAIDTFPAGRIGVFSTVVNTAFDHIDVFPQDYSSPIGPRWEGNGIGRVVDNELQFGADAYNDLPVFLKDFRAKYFDATFHMGRRHTSSSGAYLHFGDTDSKRNANVLLWHTINTGKKTSGGHKGESFTSPSTNANWPSLALGDKIWVRVKTEPDGSGLDKITVQYDQSTTPSGTWTTVYEHSGLDIDPGRIGFNRHFWGYGDIDDLTLKAYRDTTGNGQLDTWVTEFEEDFETTNGYIDVEPEYDAAGNMTYDGRYAYEYDAWNHLVTSKRAYRDSSGTLQVTSVVAEYKYDGLHRRIEKKITNSGDLDATYNDYYRDWQRIETRNGSGQVIKQNIWGLQYVDELIAAINNPQMISEPDFDHGFDIDDAQIYMAAHDSLFNVMGLFNFSRLLADANNDGHVSLSDLTILGTYMNTSTTEGPAHGDFNHDGQVDSQDNDILDDWFGVHARVIPAERYEYEAYGKRQVYISTGRHDLKAMAPVSRGQRVLQHDGSEIAAALCEAGFQGKRHDDETGLIYHNYRITNPFSERFMQTDPMGYIDGMNLHASYYAMGDGVDPYGLRRWLLEGISTNEAEIPSVERVVEASDDQIKYWIQGLIAQEEVRALQGKAYRSWRYSPWEGLLLNTSLYRCKRNLRNDKSNGCGTYCQLGLANLLSSHSYIVDSLDEGYALLGHERSGGLPSKENGAIFESPFECKQCKRTKGVLQYGSAKGTQGIYATEDELMDCVRNSRLRKDYNPYTYNCNTWSRETTRSCGLNCSG